MKIFMDMEFTGLHQHTSPISLAMRAHDGHEFYAEFTDYDVTKVDQWLMDNVILNLILPDRQTENAGVIGTLFVKSDYAGVSEAALAWLEKFTDVTIVGDCLAYDWVLFCELFGGARNIPGNVNYIPVELCTVLALHGVDPDTSREKMAAQQYVIAGMKHNALHDVRVMAAIWDFLESEGVYNAGGRMYLENFYRDKETP